MKEKNRIEHPDMKTIITFCFTGLLSLACSQHSSAQIASVSVTAPSSSLSVKAHSVKVISFNSSVSNNKVLLNWAVGENQMLTSLKWKEARMAKRLKWLHWFLERTKQIQMTTCFMKKQKK